MQDTIKQKGLRRQLISSLKAKGILNETILGVMTKIPRHFFMDPSLVNFAYEDKAYPISANQTISQPYTVAFQTELLEVLTFHKVLEIGTGSGYQTAVLLGLTPNVYTIERQQSIFKQTQRLFLQLGLRPKKQIFGDGYKGLDEYAPYDKIIVTAGAPYVPNPLLAQLKVGGRLVIPVGENVQVMTLFVRKSAKEFEKKEFGDFRFVPLLEDKN